MIRTFCDQCGTETTGKPVRVVRQQDRLTVEVLVAVDGSWNGGHACRTCVVRAVNDGQDAEAKWAGQQR